MQRQIVDMELDTGSDRTLTSAKKLFAMGDRIQVQETNLRLWTFTGDKIETVGEVMVKVEHNEQVVELLYL